MSKEDELFSRKSIRNALKAWKKVTKLGQHPLATLKIVGLRREKDGYEKTSYGYGLALRALLRDAIETLKPTEPKPTPPTPLTRRWGRYLIIKEQYIAGRPQKAVEETLDIPKGTYINWQRQAINELVNIIREWEQNSPFPPTNQIFMAPPKPPYAIMGREQILAHLRQRLLFGETLALFALNGLPGVGKTALAITLAHDEKILAHFSDGILWAGLAREPDLLSLLSLWGNALGIPASELGAFATARERAQVIHAAIGMRRMLLVIDDAWKIEHALAFKLGGPNCAYLLTSRLPGLAWDFAQEGARALQELNETDSLALVSQLVPKLVAKQPEQARQLVQQVGGLPLALILMGRYLRKMIYLAPSESAFSDALQQLQEARARLSLTMPRAYDVPLSLLASIEISDKSLTQPARQMLRALSVFSPKPNSFSEEAALAVADEAPETLKLLTEAGLLERSGPNRYTMHQAIADYASLKKNSLDEHYRRGASYFAEFAQRHRDSDGYASLDADWQNVSHFLRWAYQNEAWQMLLDGVAGLTHYNLGVVGFMDARGYWQQGRALLEQALEGARALNQPQAEALSLSKIGAFAFRQADFEATEHALQQSLAILAQQPESEERFLHQTECYEFLARLEMGRELEAAHEWIERGLSELESLKTQRASYQKGYFYVLLATLSGRMGRFPAAIRAGEKGLALLPPKPTAARVSALTTLGTVFALQGKIEQSIDYAQKGIEITEKLGDSRRLATLRMNLGNNESRRANFPAAIASYYKALQLYQQIGDHDGEGRVHVNLGLIYLVLGEDEPALGYLTTAVASAKTHGLLWREAFAKTNLANLQIYRGELAEAASALSRAYEISRRLKIISLLPVVLYWQAEIARLNGEHDQALALIEQSLQLAQENARSLAEGIGWSIKGKILDEMQRFDEAQEAHQISLEKLAAQSPYDLAHSQLAFAEHVIMRDGHLSQKATSWLMEALAIFERLGSKRELKKIKALLHE